MSATGVEGGLIGGLAGVEADVDRRIVGVGAVVGSSRLLKNGVWQWDRVLKTLILRSSWRKLGRWSRTLGLCCFLNPVLRGCRAWVAHCQVMPPWLLALPLPAPGVWPYGPDCRPWLPGTPPDRSGPAPDIASFGTRPLFSSTRRSPQPVSESAD